MIRKAIPVFFICILLLTGCWDRRELNELSLVLAIAIDKDEATGQIISTTEAVVPSELKQKGASGKVPVKYNLSIGNTIFEAKMGRTDFDRRDFFGHIKVIVISEEVAKEGIKPLLDLFARSPEIRRTAQFLISRNYKARDILGVKDGIDKVQAQYLLGIIKSSEMNSKFSSSDLLEIIKKVPEKGVNAVAGAVQIENHIDFDTEESQKNTNKGLVITDTAVFKKDKLIGYLDNKQSVALNLALGKFDQGTFDIPSLEEKDKFINVLVMKSNRKIGVQLNGNEILYTIDIKGTGSITEIQNNTDISSVKTFDSLQERVNAEIKRNVEEVISTVQKDFNSDILGFGSILQKDKPKFWSSIENDWDKYFPNAKYKVNVDIKIMRARQMLQPVGIEPTPFEKRY